MQKRRMAEWMHGVLKDHTDGHFPAESMLGVVWGADSTVIVITDDEGCVQSWAVSVNEVVHTPK